MAQVPENTQPGCGNITGQKSTVGRCPHKWKMKSLSKLFHLNLFPKTSPVVKCLPHHQWDLGNWGYFPLNLLARTHCHPGSLLLPSHLWIWTVRKLPFSHSHRYHLLCLWTVTISPLSLSLSLPTYFPSATVLNAPARYDTHSSPMAHCCPGRKNVLFRDSRHKIVLSSSIPCWIKFLSSSKSLMAPYCMWDQVLIP